MLNMETEETITCFNPRIIKKYNDDVWFEEGCLSFPDVFLDVDRPESIVVKYEDEGKEIHKVKMEGFIARIFLHEYDHMIGQNFTMRVSKLKLERALKALKKKVKKHQRQEAQTL